MSVSAAYIFTHAAGRGSGTQRVGVTLSTFWRLAHPCLCVYAPDRLVQVKEPRRGSCRGPMPGSPAARVASLSIGIPVRTAVNQHLMIARCTFVSRCGTSARSDANDDSHSNDGLGEHVASPCLS